MASGASPGALAVLIGVLAGCRTAPPAAIDPELASCVPPGARVLAGIRADQVRANPALAKLLGGPLALLTPAPNAASVLLVYTGTDLLWAARGSFQEAPAGGKLLGPQLAVMGSNAMLQAASAQHAGGRTGAPALVAQAEPVARHPVWAVAAGGASLPLAGNAANLNRLLALTDYTTVMLDADSQIQLHAAGICGSQARARQFEETLRGLLSLARAAVRDPALQSVLSAVQIRREDATVRMDAAGAPEVIEQLLGSAVRR